MPSTPMPDDYAENVANAQFAAFVILNTYREEGPAAAEALFAELRATSTPEMLALTMREIEFHSEGTVRLVGRQQ
jgi:hypothetical protein